MKPQIMTLEELLVAGEVRPSQEWQLRASRSDQCLSYVVWNTKSREALVIDPKDEDRSAYQAIASELTGYRWLGVIDSHTHADHVSIAAELAKELGAPLMMQAGAPSQRVQLRISKDVILSSQAAPLQLVLTSGHTQDSITPLWGPFLFGGDTLLYGDTGRDDLPGGDAEAHYDSVQKLKGLVNPSTLVLPGNEPMQGRTSTWATQLKVNSALTQSREQFVRESNAFDAPAPMLLKKSLRENFR